MIRLISRAGVITALCVAAMPLVTPEARAGALYAAEVWGQARLTDVDRASAQQTTIGFFGDPQGPFGLAFKESTGSLFMVDQAPSTKGLYSVDLSTGAATRVGAAGALRTLRPRGLGYDATNDIMYCSDLDTNNLFSLSLINGAPTHVVPYANFGAIEAMTFDNTNNVLWGLAGVVSGQGSGRHLVNINPATGVAISVISLGSGVPSAFRGLAWDPEQGVLWTHNNSTGFLTTLNPFTGVVTPLASTQQIGQSGTSLNAIAWVPSPGGAVLVGAGLFIGAARRRRG